MDPTVILEVRNNDIEPSVALELAEQERLLNVDAVASHYVVLLSLDGGIEGASLNKSIGGQDHRVTDLKEQIIISRRLQADVTNVTSNGLRGIPSNSEGRPE